jgi:hypothetical protein
MSQHYSDPTRENDKYSLPDLEVFYVSKTGTPWEDEDGNRLEPGWYWWTCLPGCLPDSDPSGPYATEDEALAAARE